MRNSSMRSKERTFNLKDYQKVKDLQALNYEQTAFVVENVNTKKRYIMKTIELGQTNQSRQNQRINRMINTNHSNLLKPDFFCFKFDQTGKTSTLYLLSPRYPVSLEKILVFHRNRQQFFSKPFMERFIMDMYNLVAKLNDQNNIQSRNLKPSNIFYMNEEWYVSQFGIPSCRINKYYSKSHTHVYAKARSIQYWHQGDQLKSDNDLYSLGIILLEIMTLKKVDYLNKIVNEYRSQQDQQSQQATKRYGVQMVQFAKCLIFGPKSANMAFKRLKNSSKTEYNSTQRFDYSHLQSNYPEKDLEYKVTVPQLSQFLQLVKQQKIECSKMFNMFKQYDRELFFVLPQLFDLQKIAKQFGYRNKENVINFWMYYSCISQMRYINLFKQIYPLHQIFRNIILFGLSPYEDQKQFFITQTGGAQNWPATQIVGFLKKIEVDMGLEEVTQVIKSLTKQNKRNYLTCKDIKSMVGKESFIQSKVFDKKKDKQGVSQSGSKKHIYQSQLQQMLKLLSKVNDGNLFQFFREYDPKNKWVNDYVIQRVIKQSIRMDQTRLNNALENMWSIAGIVSDQKSNYKLKYIVLLKETKQQDPVKLFKMVLTQLCNASNFKQVFEEYKQGKKGWNYQSLATLNQNQMLEFHQRQIKQVMRDLDADESKYISCQQLLFKLTGLRQYNQSVYIELLRQCKDKKKYDLVSEFMKNDTNSDLDLDNVQQLISTLESVGIEIAPEHAQKLYANYQSRDQFMYIKFLKNFYSIDHLFKQAVLFILKEHHESDFDKVFKLGLLNKSKKWTVKSIIQISDQLVLGFTTKQLQQVWKVFDPNGDLSLSKEQVADIFGIKYNKQLQQSKYIEQYEQDSELENKFSRKQGPKLSRKQTIQIQKTYHQRLEQQIEKNQILYQLRTKARKRQIMVFFIEADKQKKFGLTYKQFQDVLNKLGIVYKTSKNLKQCLKDYQFESKGDKYINYIKIMMLINSLDDQKQSENKAETLSLIINAYLQDRGISVEKMLKNTRQNNRLTLNLLQTWTSKNLMAEVFFDDLQIVWNYWGNPKYIDAKQFKYILDNSGKSQNKPYKPIVREEEKSKDKEKNMKSREDRYQMEYNKAKSQRDKKKQLHNEKYKRKQSESQIQSERELQKQKKKQKQLQWQRQKQRQFQQRQKQEADNRQKYSKNKRNQYDEDDRQSSYNKYNNKNNRLQNEASKSRNVNFKQDRFGKNQNQNKYDKEQLKYLGKPPRPDSKNKKQKRYQSQKTIQKNHFFTQLNKYGLGKIQNISKNGYVQTKELKRCLIMQYGLDQQEIQQGIKGIQRNSRVKLNDLQLHMEMQAPQLQVHSRMEPTSSELQNSSIKDFQRKHKPNKGIINQNIRLLIRAFEHKNNDLEISKWMFKQKQYISNDTFIKKWRDVTQAVTTQSLQDIFYFMNPIQKQISLLSFKLAFFQQSQNDSNCEFPPQIQKQLSYMFSKADANNNKKIQKNQISGLLSLIGLNLSSKQIDMHFKDMDMDGQNSIDYDEFKYYVERHVFKSVGNYQENIDEIRQTFNNSDFMGTGSLNIDEYKQTMNKMKINVNNDEIVSLFKDISEDQKIKIDKLMYWLSNVNKLPNQKSRMALFKIRFGKKITLKDIKSLFSKLPTAYTLSYCANAMKNRQILASSAMEPKMDESKLFFKDFYYTNICKLQSNTPCLQRVEKLNQLSLMLKIDEATGVPIPTQSNFNRNNILRRYLSICFFDMNQQKIKDSICEFDAAWDPDNEDIWLFNDSLGFDKQILVKIGDYNYQTFDQMLIMFEFNATYCQNGHTVQISCGSASLPIKQISRLSSVTDKKLQINGGIPTKKKYFKKQDINAKRSVFKKIFTIGQIESVLKLQVLPSFKFKDKQKFIDILPLRIICPSSCIDLYYCFRQYFSYNTVVNSQIVSLFANQNRSQTFLHALDCRNIYSQLIPFWNKNVQYKYSKDIRNLKKWLQIIIDQIYILLMNKDFNFMVNYPSYNSLGDKTLHNARTKLIKQTFENVLNQMKGQQKKYKIQATAFKPIRAHKEQEIAEDNIIRSLRIKNK